MGGSAGAGCYTRCMNLTTALPPQAAFTWQRTARIVAINIAFWLALSLVGALTSLNDDLRRGVQGSFWLIWLDWCFDVSAQATFSLLLYAMFTRWPQLVSSLRNIVLCYGVLVLLLLPLQLLFLSRLYLREDGPGLTWAAVESQVETIDNYASLLRLASASAVYFATVAIKVWQQNLARGRVLAQAQAERLELHLALERQRGLALRAQLEPHFVFNALNAISALVRSDGKDAALQGIQGLSELLRYALTAGEKEWASFAEELEFIEDYLSLQRLRHGARLYVVIEGVTADVLDCDCPPLLLQPLVENAMRHDLDRHEDASDIRLAFACADGRLSIHVSNPVHRGAAENPGTGLGLRNTEERLKLAYGEAAVMQAGVEAGRFAVDIRVPMHARE